MRSRTLFLYKRRPRAPAFNFSRELMASLFLRAVSGLRAAAQSAVAQAAQPVPAPVAPLIWDKRHEEELKRIIPLSIIEFKDGTFAATPAKRCIQRDGPTGLKLFASAEGRLDGGSSAVDIANVKQIAVGILTDPAVGGSAGAAADSLKWFGVECAVHPVAASPFSELDVSAPPGGAMTRARIPNILQQLAVSWKPWGVVAGPTFQALAGLPSSREAAAAVLTEDAVVGAPSTFSPARSAILSAFGVLVAPPAGTAGPSAPSVTALTYATFLAGIIGDSSAAGALAVVLATKVVPCTSTDPTVVAVHGAAQRAAEDILTAARGVIDSIGAAEAGWVRDQCTAMRNANFTVSMEQLGSLVARAPKEAVVAAAPAPAPTAAPAPPAAAGLSASDVANIVAAALENRFGRFPTSPPPLPPPMSSPGALVPHTPPTLPAPPSSPFPTLDALSHDPVTDASSAADALLELGNGDGDKLCDMLAKLEGDMLDMANFMGLPLEERAADAERRILRMATLSHTALLASPRPASWIEARSRLGAIVAAYQRRAAPTGASPGPPGAPDRHPPPPTKPSADTYCSPKDASSGDFHGAVSSGVIASAMGSAAVLQDAAAPHHTSLRAECERLRDSFSQSASAYFISNSRIAGTQAGKRGEGMLPLRLERAREALLASVVAELEHRVGAKRLTSPEIREEVRKTAEACCVGNFQVGPLTRLLGGATPIEGFSVEGSTATGRWGSHVGGSAAEDALAITDIQLMASRLEVILKLIFVEALGCDIPVSATGRLQDGFGLSEFVSSTSTSLSVSRLVAAIEQLFNHLREQCYKFRHVTGAPTPNVSASVAWALSKYAIPLANEQAAAAAGAAAAAAASAALLATMQASKGAEGGAKRSAPEGDDGKRKKKQKQRKAPGGSPPATQPAKAAPEGGGGAGATTGGHGASGEGGGGDKPPPPRSIWEPNSIKSVTRSKPDGAWAAWEQLCASAAPNLASAERPCFYHFCFIRSGDGQKSGCEAAHCSRSHVAPSDLAPFQAALDKIRRAGTEAVRKSIRSTLLVSA